MVGRDSLVQYLRSPRLEGLCSGTQHPYNVEFALCVLCSGVAAACIICVRKVAFGVRGVQCVLDWLYHDVRMASEVVEKTDTLPGRPPGWRHGPQLVAARRVSAHAPVSVAVRWQP